MWLLGAGIIMALVAALFGFTDFVGDARIRDISDAWQHLIGNLVAVVLVLINWFIRYKSGAAAGVFPWGFWISLVTVLLLVFNGWKGWEMVYRHHVGVADTAQDEFGDTTTYQRVDVVAQVSIREPELFRAAATSSADRPQLTSKTAAPITAQFQIRTASSSQSR